MWILSDLFCRSTIPSLSYKLISKTSRKRISFIVERNTITHDLFYSAFWKRKWGNLSRDQFSYRTSRRTTRLINSQLMHLPGSL